MTTLIQGAPLSDAVDPVGSETYSNQLTITNTTGPLFWTTSVSAPQLVVSAGGQVTSTGALDLGTYRVSGTVVDTHSNSGTWSFTLTVVISPVPQATLMPVQSQLPTGIEIAIPFMIDPATGGVAYLSNYLDILEQHIETIVLTLLEERVMLPTYGTPLESSVFAPIQGSLNAMLGADIRRAVAQWEPAVQIQNVSVSTPSDNPASLAIVILFSVVPFTNVNAMTISTGGAVTQVSGS